MSTRPTWVSIAHSIKLFNNFIFITIIVGMVYVFGYLLGGLKKRTRRKLLRSQKTPDTRRLDLIDAVYILAITTLKNYPSIGSCVVFSFIYFLKSVVQLMLKSKFKSKILSTSSSVSRAQGALLWLLCIYIYSKPH